MRVASFVNARVPPEEEEEERHPPLVPSRRVAWGSAQPAIHHHPFHDPATTNWFVCWRRDWGPHLHELGCAYPMRVTSPPTPIQTLEPRLPKAMEASSLSTHSPDEGFDNPHCGHEEASPRSKRGRRSGEEERWPAAPHPLREGLFGQVRCGRGEGGSVRRKTLEMAKKEREEEEEERRRRRGASRPLLPLWWRIRRGGGGGARPSWGPPPCAPLLQQRGHGRLFP